MPANTSRTVPTHEVKSFSLISVLFLYYTSGLDQLLSISNRSGGIPILSGKGPINPIQRQPNSDSYLVPPDLFLNARISVLSNGHAMFL